MCLARQCYDEARHAVMFRRLFEKRGGTVGEYPVMNFQYRIITRFDNLAARLAIQNRSFEAGGLDAITAGIKQTREDGDHELASSTRRRSPTRSRTCASPTSGSASSPPPTRATCSRSAWR
jgi:hypothetical protein